MPRPGRNAPCPCGSGKKYKKCCALKVIQFPSRYTDAERSSLSEKIQRYSMAPRFASDFEMASSIFFGATEVGPEGLPDHAYDEAQNQFFCWYLYDMELEDGLTISSMMLDQKAGDLNPGERTYLRLAAATAVRCYRVIEVRPEEGMTLEDVVSKERVDIREKLATRSLAKWDVFFTRVMLAGDGEDKVMEGGVLHFPAEHFREIKSKLDYRRRKFKKDMPGGDDTAFFKRVAPIFFGLWADRFLPTPQPNLCNTDGERLAPTEILYEVNDWDAMLTFLDGHPELDRENPEKDKLAWVWLEAEEASASPGSTLLGRIELDEEEGLTAEVNSLERAARIRELIEETGDAVSFDDSQTEEMKQLLVKGDAEMPLPEISETEEIREKLQEYCDVYYRAWIDQPIPALEKRSPREAVEERRLRPIVVELIRGLESQHERDMRLGKASHDPTWMWKELGLRRPK